jgi:SRSO17 transposase
MLEEMTGPAGWDVLARPLPRAAPARSWPPPLRRQHRLPAGTGAAGLAVRGRGQGHHQRAPGRRPAGGSCPGGGPGRPRKPGYPAPPANLRTLAIANAGKIRQVTWRQGTKAAKGNPAASMTRRFLAIRVRPANRDIPRGEDGSLPDCWLLAEWPPGADEPTDYWLSNLPRDTPIGELARLAKIRWRIHDYRELKTGLGLDHFEGRSFTGWHRHVTWCGTAHLGAV